MRQVTRSSTTRSSWHRGPMLGIGRECGMPILSPRCNWRSSVPASTRASVENGGVFTSPLSQTKGLSLCVLALNICQIWHVGKAPDGDPLSISPTASTAAAPCTWPPR